MNCGLPHPGDCRKDCWNCGSSQHTVRDCPKDITRVPPAAASQFAGWDPYDLYQWNGTAWQRIGHNYTLERNDVRRNAPRSHEATRRMEATGQYDPPSTKRARSPSPLRQIPPCASAPSPPSQEAQATKRRRVEAGEKKDKTLERGGLQIKGRASAPTQPQRRLPSADPRPSRPQPRHSQPPPRQPPSTLRPPPVATSLSAWNSFHQVAHEQERAEDLKTQRELDERRERERVTGARQGPTYRLVENFRQVDSSGTNRTVVPRGLSIRGRGGLSIRGRAGQDRQTSDPAQRRLWDGLDQLDEEEGALGDWADEVGP